MGPVCYPILAAVALARPVSPVKGNQGLWYLEERTLQAMAEWIPAAGYLDFSSETGQAPPADPATAPRPPTPEERAGRPSKEPIAGKDNMDTVDAPLGGTEEDYATQLALVLANDPGAPRSPCTSSGSRGGGSESRDA